MSKYLRYWRNVEKILDDKVEERRQSIWQESAYLFLVDDLKYSDIVYIFFNWCFKIVHFISCYHEIRVVLCYREGNKVEHQKKISSVASINFSSIEGCCGFKSLSWWLITTEIVWCSVAKRFYVLIDVKLYNLYCRPVLDAGKRKKK